MKQKAQPYKAQRMEGIAEYVFAPLLRLVRELEQKSERPVLNLAIGDPDIPPSNTYLAALQHFYQEPSAHRYPGYVAIPEFRDTLIRWYEERFGVTLSEDELLPLCGAKDGIAHLPWAILNSGDEVLIPDPGYPAYASSVQLVGAIPIVYSVHATGSSIDHNELARICTPKTRCLWLNAPSNPTGATLTKTELVWIVELARKHNLIILYDNTYAEITFNGYRAPSILQIPEAREIAIEIGSFSKTFSFAGYRMGWAVGNKNIIAALAKLKSLVDSGLSLPLQHLGAFALSNFDQKWHDTMLSTYQRRREILATKLRRLGLTFALPQGALYIWAKIPDSAINAETFCMELLNRKRVLLAPGTAFGRNGERFVRVSICINIDKIDEYIK